MDQLAEHIYSWAESKGTDWGTIDTLPGIPGLALYKDGLTGHCAGDGWPMEWQGFNAGCVKTQVKKRPWAHWNRLPFIDYGNTSGAQPAEEAITV